MTFGTISSEEYKNYLLICIATLERDDPELQQYQSTWTFFKIDKKLFIIYSYYLYLAQNIKMIPDEKERTPDPKTLAILVAGAR